MATLTIKNVPDKLVRRLKVQAAHHRRSLNLEVITCLEAATGPTPVDPEGRRAPVIIVDTSMLVYIWVRGDRTPAAEAVLGKDPVWAAPSLWRSEFRSTLLSFIRRGATTLDHVHAAMLLQGDAGSTVDLAVVRVRHPEPQTVKLTRANFTPPPVESKMLAGQVGYINIDALSAAHVKEVASAIQKLQKDGAQKLVVDVRNWGEVEDTGPAQQEPEPGVPCADASIPAV